MNFVRYLTSYFNVTAILFFASILLLCIKYSMNPDFVQNSILWYIQNNYSKDFEIFMQKEIISLWFIQKTIPFFSLQQSLIVQNRKVNLSRYMYFIWSIFKIHTKIYDIITFKAYKPKTGFTLVTSSIINEVITLVAMYR